MSLGIAFKGAEGIVLAADSRVTIMAQVGPQVPGEPQVIFPATFDNATKLLRVTGQKYVGAVTYGVGVIGQTEPRTAHSFIPEFEAELLNGGNSRLSVQAFAKALSDFFSRQWSQHMPADMPPGNEMIFLVGGYDQGAAYGRVFEVYIPTRPEPVERHGGPGEFGMVWGGQREYADRIITGFDTRLPELVTQHLNLTAGQKNTLEHFLKEQFQAPIPFQFLPLQDCVDIAIMLIRTTMTVQMFLIGIRGVGGKIDVATITRTDGLQYVQSKRISGEPKETEE